MFYNIILPQFRPFWADFLENIWKLQKVSLDLQHQNDRNLDLMSNPTVTKH